MVLHETAINEPLLCNEPLLKQLSKCLNCTIQWFGANNGKLTNYIDSETKSGFGQISQSTVEHESANLNELLCTFTYIPTVNNT